MKTFIKQITILWSIVAIAFFAGCSDDIDPLVTSLDTDRLFSPINFKAEVVNKTSARLSWTAVNGAQSYNIEFYANGNQDYSGTPVKTVNGVTYTQVPYTVPGFDGETAYSVRVQAIGSDIDNSKWVGGTYKTAAEQIMYAVQPDDLKPTSVTLRWQAPNNVTNLTLTPTNGSATSYTISSEEAEAGAKTIEGLTPETVYSAKLYNGTTVRGSTTFETSAVVPDGAIILQPGDDLATIIANCESGSIIAFPKESHYDIAENTLLPSDITFWGQAGNTKPVLSMNGFKLGTTSGTIKFDNIDITGYKNNDQTQAKQNYIFNQSDATQTQNVIFENCIIRNLANTPFRLQGSNAITIENLTFKNCIAYDCGVNAGGNGTYAFIHTNVATGKINHIEITGSTIYTIGYGLILHNAAPSQSVSIKNSTLYNTTGDARYFIDYNAQSAGSLVIENVIIGKTLSPSGTARGIRAAAAPSVTNSYQTSDCTFSANPISGITAYGQSSTVLFEDPTNGDFRIQDDSFAGKDTAGDPRWRVE